MKHTHLSEEKKREAVRLCKSENMAAVADHYGIGIASLVRWKRMYSNEGNEVQTIPLDAELASQETVAKEADFIAMENFDQSQLIRQMRKELVYLKGVSMHKISELKDNRYLKAQIENLLDENSKLKGKIVTADKKISQLREKIEEINSEYKSYIKLVKAYMK